MVLEWGTTRIDKAIVVGVEVVDARQPLESTRLGEKDFPKPTTPPDYSRDL